jgi:hypothetical protein
MNILITCHLPPGFNHKNVFQLNTNVYKKNKTRKVRNLKNTVDTYFYLDTSFKVPENTKNFFSNWEDVPENSLDIIWGHNCPAFGPFLDEEYYDRLKTKKEGGSFLDEYDGTFWHDIMKHGQRILKKGGKIVIPFPQTWIGWISDTKQMIQIAHIINTETNPDFRYKVIVVKALSNKHRKILRNRFILNMNNFERKVNDEHYHTNPALNLDEAFKFLVFIKP